MTSSADNKQKTCGICSVSVASAGQGQAIFNAECSHAFHFPCINTYLSNGNRICPVCSARWNNLPSVPPVPPPNPFVFPVQNPNFQPFTFNPTPQFPRNRFSLFHGASEPEPLCFNDDEPLPDAGADDHMAIDADSQKVAIKVIPERKAVAASESVSQFAVLVGLRAPPLSDVRSSQRAPIDIVTVLDVSGSMFGRKLNLVKSAVNFVIDNLGVSDRLSIVSFSHFGRRILPLRRMTESGREEAKRAVDALVAEGGTNILDGLKKGAQVLEERRQKNPVNSIVFLSDGNDTCQLKSLLDVYKNFRNATGYLDELPASIFPRNEGSNQGTTIPVHSFGFGSDHDPITMHDISDASGGTFSFIESYEMIQDAFAGCIGGLLSVVTQELRLNLRSASHGVEIKSIPSGRYWSEVSNQGSEGLINVGELYADEEKEFLINLSIPVNSNEGEDSERKTSLLDITCSYKDTISKQSVVVEGDLVEVRRPKVPSSQDLAVNLEVDRQRNRLRVAESIKQAQEMAEAGNHSGATKLLAEKRSDLMATAAAQAEDGMTKWLEGEMKETEMRMGSARMYLQSGRAYALSGMSSHASQRATTRGRAVAGAAFSSLQQGCPPPGAAISSMPFGCPAPGAEFGAPASCYGGSGAAFGGYATPQMGNMVTKSRQQQQQSKAGEGNASN